MAFRITRTAQASWSGTVPEGGGRIALGSGVFEGPFTLRARIEEGVRGDQPRGADRRGSRRLLHDVAREPAQRGGPSARGPADDRARRPRATRRRLHDHAHRARRTRGASRASTRRRSRASPSRRRRPARCRARSPGRRSRSTRNWWSANDARRSPSSGARGAKPATVAPDRRCLLPVRLGQRGVSPRMRTRQ